jgi:hypothetical protein
VTPRRIAVGRLKRYEIGGSRWAGSGGMSLGSWWEAFGALGQLDGE